MYQIIALALLTIAILFQGCSRPIPQPKPESTPAGPSTAEGAAFPLGKKSGERCLVDQQGRPYLLHGDAAWSLLVQLTREEAERYLDDRSKRGFNTLLINLIEHEAAAHPPRNAYGEAPFADDADYARPNEKYFSHADWVLQRAAERGFLVLLAPSYMGYNGGSEGWYREMQDNGAGRLRAYGRYLGLRYQKMGNIIWVHGGDYNPPERALMQAVMEGIRETAPGALHTFHGGRGTSARAFLGDQAAWLDLNNIYTDESGVVTAAQKEYTTSSLPFFLIEARYEEMGATPAVVRDQAYQAMLSGACGQLMGHKVVWPFATGWERALDSPGARSMTQARLLLEELEWPKLIPAYDGFIIEGGGTGVARAVAAVSDDRRRAVVYIPTGREIVVDTRRLAGRAVKLTWIDPVNARTFPGKDSLGPRPARIHPPGANSAGESDWVVVLETKK